jgi:chaperonin cofactor prefoldin
MEELAAAQARTEQRVEGLEAAVQRLIEAQVRTEQRVEGLEAAVQRLTEAQVRTEQRVEGLEAAVQRLTEAQVRTEQRMEELVAAQARTEQRMEELAAAQKELGAISSDLQGWQVELRYQERAVAYFGPLLRRMRVVFPNEMEDELEARLSREEFQDLLRLDLLVSGQPRYRPDAPQVWLAVEVSAVVDRHDVERAHRRAATLRRAGYRAIPTVAGEQATAGAEEEARIRKMLLLRDGRALFWEEALEEALSG